MIKMCRLIEIKFRAAGGRSTFKSCPGPIGFSKTEAFYLSSCGLSIIGIVLYKPSTRVIEIAVDLKRWRGRFEYWIYDSDDWFASI